MKYLFLFLLAVSLVPYVPAQSDTTTFAGGLDGWSAGFADYPVGQETFYGLTAVHARLPVPLDTTQYSLMISGDNHSDDLFMYMKKQITGLLPNTTYSVRFDVELASNASTTAFGAGGPPGLGVTVKCGATAAEPLKVIDAMQYYRMNIDIGNQMNPGADMDTIGNVAVTDTTTVYALIMRSNATHQFQVNSDANGNVWIIVGTDSGFEGVTTLYYNRIIVTFSAPVPVELASFDAKRRNGVTVLQWTTESETANHGFAVERSSDRSTWTQIGFVPGHGTTTERRHYRFDDGSTSLVDGGRRQLYYRLKQIDFDGSSSISPVVTVAFPMKLMLAQNFPNPFIRSTDIFYEIPESGQVLLTVHDAAGRRVALLDAGVRAPGSYRVPFDGTALTSGIYFCRLNWSGQQSIRRMLLVR